MIVLCFFLLMDDDVLLILCDDVDGVVWLMMNCLYVVNVLFVDVIWCLCNEFVMFDDNLLICVIVICGVGECVFSVGVDFGDFEICGMQLMCGFVCNVYELILELCKLIIVVVNGYVIGGGCEIVFVCDLWIVVDNVIFVLFEVWVGMGVNFVSVLLLCMLLYVIVMELLFMGCCFDVDEV